MNRTILGIWGSTILISAAIILFILWPGISQDLSTIRETKTAQEKLNETTNMKQILIDLNKNDQLGNLVSIAKNYIPEEPQSGELILELTAIASHAQINIDQLSIAPSKTAAKPSTAENTGPGEGQTTQASQSSPSSDMNELGFQMSLSGSFQNFQEFLKLIETSSRLITIQSLSMGQSKNSFTAQVTGKSYYKKANVFSGNIADITLSPTTIAKLQNLKTYANPIDTQQEAGFGRNNPFDTIR